MSKELTAISKFSSWEEEDVFWSTHDLTELDLEEDKGPAVIKRNPKSKTPTESHC